MKYPRGITLEQLSELGLKSCQPITYETMAPKEDHRIRIGYFGRLHIGPPYEGLICRNFPAITIYKELYSNHQTEFIPLEDIVDLVPLMPLDGEVTISLRELNRVSKKE